jgi:PIN domain nuclease of toxin-antitoxin system
VRLLLDTQALLWSLGRPALLRPDARGAIEDGENDVIVSAASVWEVAIKRATGKLDARIDLVAEIEKAALIPLTVTLAHAVAAGALPPHHGDPFDRMLIAQAQLEGLTVVTRDPRFRDYGVSILQA